MDTDLFKTKTLMLWHPSSPGVKVRVRRNWWQRLLRPAESATLGEAIRASGLGQQRRSYYKGETDKDNRKFDAIYQQQIRRIHTLGHEALRREQPPEPSEEQTRQLEQPYPKTNPTYQW